MPVKDGSAKDGSAKEIIGKIKNDRTKKYNSKYFYNLPLKPETAARCKLVYEFMIIDPFISKSDACKLFNVSTFSLIRWLDQNNIDKKSINRQVIKRLFNMLILKVKHKIKNETKRITRRNNRIRNQIKY